MRRDAVMLIIEGALMILLWWWRSMMDGGTPDGTWMINAIGIGIVAVAMIATLIVLIKRITDTKEV